MHLVGCADIVAAIIVAKSKFNQVIIRTTSYLEDKGLKLAREKTELIFLVKKCIPFEIDITTCGTTFKSKKVFNYLGIRPDPRLTFWVQIRHTATNVAKIISLLSRLMANIGDHTQIRRRLMMAITDSILLYGSEFGTDALKADCRLKILSSIQRTSALKVVPGYRTASMSAILNISSVIPIDLKASERKRAGETKT